MSDVLIVLGILSISVGGWLFHPGVGLVLLGAFLLVIGARIDAH